PAIQRPVRLCLESGSDPVYEEGSLRLCRFPAGVAPHFVEKGSDPDFLSADVRDDAVELVEAMIADHEAAAALAVLDGDGCTEPLRKLHLESAHVRVLRASARVVAGRPRLGPAGEPAD